MVEADVGQLGGGRGSAGDFGGQGGGRLGPLAGGGGCWGPGGGCGAGGVGRDGDWSGGRPGSGGVHVRHHG